jgi:glycosyltransferase involved in cell wall biosynthesis
MIAGGCQRPGVSVVMAVLRPHPRYFREAVRSILTQTFQDFELVIVEDPSPEPGRDLLDEFQDRRLRYFLNPRRTSLVAQRNRGLAEARADLVAVQDADDISEPTRLERQVEYLRAQPEVSVVGSQVCVIDGDGAVCGYRAFPLEHDRILRAMNRFLPIAQPSAMFRKAAVVAAGGYADNGAGVAEDYDLVSRLALQGTRFANLPDALLRYRLHPGQLKATDWRNIVRGTVLVKRRYWRGRLDLPARLWLWAEYLLLGAPPALVRPLLFRLLYQDPRAGVKPPGRLPEAPPLRLVGAGGEGPTGVGPRGASAHRP